MSLFKQNENFLQSEFFLTVLNFFKGDTNIYFEYLTFFEKKKKKSFTEKNKIFVKIIYFFLKYIYIFSNSFATFEQPYTGTTSK